MQERYANNATLVELKNECDRLGVDRKGRNTKDQILDVLVPELRAECERLKVQEEIRKTAHDNAVAAEERALREKDYAKIIVQCARQIERNKHLIDAFLKGFERNGVAWTLNNTSRSKEAIDAELKVKIFTQTKDYFERTNLLLEERIKCLKEARKSSANYLLRTDFDDITKARENQFYVLHLDPIIEALETGKCDELEFFWL